MKLIEMMMMMMMMVVEYQGGSLIKETFLFKTVDRFNLLMMSCSG